MGYLDEMRDEGVVDDDVTYGIGLAEVPVARWVPM